MDSIRLGTIIDSLWGWFSTAKERPCVKDTTKINSVKYDMYLESSTSDPLSYSVFELSDKGELIVDNVSKLVESKAAYFLFVNPDKNFMVMVRNNLENCKRLVQGEKVENLKVRVVN